LKHFLANLELNQDSQIEDKSKFRDVIFTDQEVQGDNSVEELEDRILIRISLHKYLDILT
jgi:hypothetical protein